MADEMTVARARGIALGAKAMLEVAELKLDGAGYRDAAKELYDLRLRFDRVMAALPALPSGGSDR